jgi:hypothetical protein
MAMDPNRTSKYDQLWVGPYRVTEVKETGSYIITSDTGDSLHRSIDQLKVIPDPDEEEQSFVVEKILAHRDKNKTRQYLVKWKGYSNKHNEWLPSNKFDDDRIIRNYWDSRKKSNNSKDKRR